MYVAVLGLALGFTACGSDDDGGTPNSFDCNGITITKGDNGNGFIGEQDLGSSYDLLYNSREEACVGFGG